MPLFCNSPLVAQKLPVARRANLLANDSLKPLARARSCASQRLEGSILSLLIAYFFAFLNMIVSPFIGTANEKDFQLLVISRNWRRMGQL